jgi:Bacterial protein of unknown function (DUF922)
MGLDRSFLEGHEEKLIWADFQANAPGGSTSEAAFASARFDLNFDYDWDDAQGSAHGYRVGHVQVTVEIERSLMWSVKKDRSDAVLQHEQGHYDIVALLGRDLYNELGAWDSGTKPKRFRKETDLKDEVNRTLRRYKKLAVEFAGSSSAVGTYDKKTKHGVDAKAQEKWTAGLATARTNGKPLVNALSGLRT